MKCCSRSTLGVSVGALLGICFIIASVLSIHFLANRPYYYIDNDTRVYYDRDPAINTDLIVILVLSSTFAIISVLLIIGIIKRRHYLMIPWLILSAIFFVLSCLPVLYAPIAFYNGKYFNDVLLVFILCCISLVIQALILKKIYELYKDIRDKNNGRAGPNISAGQADNAAYPTQNVYYSVVPEKTQHN